MKLIKIPSNRIKVKEDFNVREDFGDFEDLENSILEINGNISPLGVTMEGKDYKLLFGERRLRILQKHNIDASCVLFEDIENEQEKFLLMFHENLGRKDLTWQEEAKALKILSKYKGDSIKDVIKTAASQKNVHERTVWRLLEAGKAIEEFPGLEREKSRQKVLEIYERLNALSPTAQSQVKEGKITIKEALLPPQKPNVEFKKINANNAVIEELKQEVKHHVDNIYEIVKKKNAVERVKNGLWTNVEVKEVVEAVRICEDFGNVQEQDKECVKCNSNDKKLYTQCKFYNRVMIKNAE